MRQDAYTIIQRAINSVLPDEAVFRALNGRHFSGRLYLVAVGKAAWQMANAAYTCLGDCFEAGVVITKYDHLQGPIGKFSCYEAGHPVPDENSFGATQAAIDLVQGLSKEDTVVFLLSGGGSALFEKPLVSGTELQSITSQLLASGASIVEINTIRKRLSAVKGGRFAQLCAPAAVFSVILSDILGDPLDMIASGPTCPDCSTSKQAVRIANKYGLQMSEYAWKLLQQETPKNLENVEAKITGSVRELCRAAEQACQGLGYTPVLLTDRLNCEARHAGSFLGSIAASHCTDGKSLAFLVGGETVVRLTGTGKGGRNQELALAAAEEISGLENVVVFSIGSDGTDGPTDVAGGLVTGETLSVLRTAGIEIPLILANNDAYHALQKSNGLVITGPTGTNVNDLSVALIRA